MSLINEYDLELDRVCRIIKSKTYKKVIIQLPAGLKRYARYIAEYVESRTGKTIFIKGEPCYGACDLEFIKPSQFIVNLGHSEIPYLKSPKTIFIECGAKHEIKGVVEKACKRLEKEVGLAIITQYIHRLEEAKCILERNNFNISIGKPSNRLKYRGQVLGCNFFSCLSICSKVNNYLYLGTGNFHPLGIALATNKKVIVADPELKEVRDVERLKEEILKQRWSVLERAMDAEVFGIVLGRKLGQRREKLALNIKKNLEEISKKALLIEVSDVRPEYLENFNCHAFISTACPRIAIDDFAKFSKPVLTPIELEILLGKRKWNEYEFDQIN